MRGRKRDNQIKRIEIALNVHYAVIPLCFSLVYPLPYDIYRYIPPYKQRKPSNTNRAFILDCVLRHPNEAILIGLVNFWKLVLIFSQLIGQFSSVQHAIGPSGLDHRALFADGEVLPLERRSHVLFEESQYLVVGDGAGVSLLRSVSNAKIGGWEGLTKL